MTFPTGSLGSLFSTSNDLSSYVYDGIGWVSFEYDQVDTLTDLANINIATITNNKIIFVKDIKRGGLFVFDTSSLTNEVGYETSSYNGIYNPPQSDATGASGAWVRVEYIVNNSNLKPEWFGAVRDGTTDDSPSFQAMVDFSLNFTGNNFVDSSPPVFTLTAGEYYLASQINVDSTHHGIAFFGSGKNTIISTDFDGPLFAMGTDVRSPGWPETDFSSVTPFDTTGISFLYSIRFEDIFFKNTDATLVNSCCLLFSIAADIRVLNCQFKDFYIHIDSHRINRSFFTGNRHFGTGRTTVAAQGFMRFQSVFNSTLTASQGGGVHITDCEFQGASNPNEDKHNYCVKLHGGDGYYFNNTHFTMYDRAISVEPAAGTHNKTITDLFFSQCYFDNVAVSGRDVDLLGSVDADSTFQNIHFDNCYFRGATQGAYGIVCSVDDTGGAFEADTTKELKNISFNHCRFRQHTTQAIKFNGATNSKITADNVLINSCIFEDGRVGSPGATSDISVNVKNINITSNMFQEASEIPNYSISIDTNGVPANDISVIIANNSFTDSNYAMHVPWSIDYEQGASVDISNNLLKVADNVGSAGGNIWRESNSYSAKSDSDNSIIVWEHELIDNNTLCRVNAFIIGQSTDASSDTVVRKLRAVVRKNNSGSIAFLNTTSGNAQVEEDLNTITDNDEPALIVPMFGSAFPASSAVTSGDIYVNSGRVYLVVVSGTTAATGPTHSDLSIQDSGTAKLSHLGSESTNKIALVLSAGQGTTAAINWNATVELLRTN